MASISQEQPPLDIEVELKEFLSRRFVDVGIALNSSHVFEPITALPQKPKQGTVNFFSVSVGAEIPAPGLYVFMSPNWVLLGGNPIP
jgi:hypothetical protein